MKHGSQIKEELESFRANRRHRGTNVSQERRQAVVCTQSRLSNIPTRSPGGKELCLPAAVSVIGTAGPVFDSPLSLPPASNPPTSTDVI